MSSNWALNLIDPFFTHPLHVLVGKHNTDYYPLLMRVSDFAIDMGL
jgi:hypothetical protein